MALQRGMVTRRTPGNCRGGFVGRSTIGCVDSRDRFSLLHQSANRNEPVSPTAGLTACSGEVGGERSDVLHNNVGIESRKDLLETTEEEWDQVLEVDLKSVFLATRAAVPALIARGGGSVICVSSIAGHRGHGRTAYAAAKAGIEGFVRTVAVQLGPQGVRINAIAPGTVWTPMVEGLGPEARERRRKASPLGTEGTGWDVGWGAVYLASDESRWVTGQVLVIDAGLTATTR